MSTSQTSTIGEVAQRDLGHRSSKSLDALADELAADEQPVAMLKTRFVGEVTDGLLALTDRRLVFVKRGVLKQHAVTYALDTISAVAVAGRLPRKVTITTDGAAVVFDTETGQDATQTFVDTLTAHTTTTAPTAAAEEPVPLADVAGAEWMSVVGESRHQEDIDLLFDPAVVDLEGPRPSWAVLLREPENPHDPNAVQVLIAGSPVGYLARENAERFAPFFDLYPAAMCPAMIRGPRGYRGVVLRVDYATLEDPDTAEVTTVPTLLWG